MRWDERLTIRGRLFLLLAALAIPFLVYLTMSTWFQASEEREHAREQMLGIAHLTAAHLDDHVSDIRQLLGVLALVVDPQPASAGANDALFRRLASKLPRQINNVSVWDANGANVGVLDGRLRSRSPNVASRPFFRDAMKGGGELVVEAPVLAISNGEKVAVFAIGIERAGKVVGVVAASAQLKPLQSIIGPEIGLPAGAVVTVVDASGVVVSRSLDPNYWIGRPLRTSVKARAPARDGVSDGPSADGVERIGGVTTAKRLPWRVYVGIPTETALAPVRQRLAESLMVGGAMLALGLLASASIGKRISAPLRQLGEDAAMLERGHLQHRSEVRQGGEIGTLSKTLNRMASSLQEAEQRLRQLAEFDTLTGLANRALFHDRLAQAMTRAARHGQLMALLFLDVDHFKTVNDTLGHEGGDQVLVELARSLAQGIRASDTVARWAGDEFTIILEGLGSSADAGRIAQSLVEKARRTLHSNGKHVKVSVSVGIALLTARETDASAILRRADGALYEAKRLGRDRFAMESRVAASGSVGDAEPLLVSSG